MGNFWTLFLQAVRWSPRRWRIWILNPATRIWRRNSLRATRQGMIREMITWSDKTRDDSKDIREEGAEFDGTFYASWDALWVYLMYRHVTWCYIMISNEIRLDVIRCNIGYCDECIHIVIHAALQSGLSQHANDMLLASSVTFTMIHSTLYPPLLLHYTTLVALHYCTLHYTTFHNNAVHCTALHYTTLHCTTFHYTALHCTAL